VDPDNPTCPANPNWSTNREMRVMVAKGVVDDALLPRLQAALNDESIEEIRLRSPGGNAKIGNQDVVPASVRLRARP
jgi:hypothetical protein